MSYVELIPPMIEYARKFKQLDSLDFKIIRALRKCCFGNLSRLAENVDAPQQTVSYHVRRLGAKDLVRFRGLIDEAKLGLKSYSVIASTPVGKEEPSGCALTSFPLWRYLAVVDGWRHGNYVRYTVPPDKERDLVAFLNELVRKELVSGFEIIPTLSPKYPLLDLDFYLKKEGIPVFDWQRWIKSLDSFIGGEIVEKMDYEKAEFDLIDLLILRCLELNARMSQRKMVQEIGEILKEKNHKKFIPLVSRRIRKRIHAQRLIKGCRAYLFPNQGSTVLFFTLHLTFSNSTSLQRFERALEHLPYNTAYEKILGKNALFVRIIIPTYEYSNMRESLAELAQEGFLKNSKLLLGDLTNGTWDNVEIHQMFTDGTWNFSYGSAMKMLETRVARAKQSSIRRK